MNALHDTRYAHTEAALEAREVKALRLARLLVDRGIPSWQAEHASAGDRRWFARVADVRPPSDETWDRVLVLLRTEGF